MWLLLLCGRWWSCFSDTHDRVALRMWSRMGSRYTRKPLLRRDEYARKYTVNVRCSKHLAGAAMSNGGSLTSWINGNVRVGKGRPT